MSDFGIICEFNPLHRGHQYLIRQAREMGADRIVCVMSGNSVQRGSLAVTDKYTRAACAILAGADLVLELPYPWCSASAEGFARGGICVLRDFVSTVIFGSECGNIDLLSRAAENASNEAFRAQYLEHLEQGAPAAGAYYQMLEEKVGFALSSNDILGMEYLRAAEELGADLRFLTVKRNGAAYRQKSLCDGEFPSATGIRAMWEQGDLLGSETFLPTETISLFREARKEGKMTDESRLESLILGWFRLHDGEDFSEIMGADGGLGHRFCSVAREVTSLKEFYEKIRTKRYTDAHLRRVLLYCLTGVRKEEMVSLPQYTTLLAVNEKGRALLSEARKRKEMAVVTKPSDAPVDQVQYDLTNRVDSLFSLATERGERGDWMLKQTPKIF